MEGKVDAGRSDQHYATFDGDCFISREVNLKVCIVGAGYVGLNTAVVLAYLRHDLCCIVEESIQQYPFDKAWRNSDIG